MVIAFVSTISQVHAYSGTTQIYFGAFVGPDHHGTLTQITAFETEVGKGLSIWSWFQYWNRPDDSANSAEFNPTWMDECRTHGSIPMITWDPGDGGGISSSNPTEYPNLSHIIQGDMDSYITQWAQAAKAWGHPFFIRLMHEFNGDWTPWCEGVNGNTQGQFVQAWIHIVNIFKEVGATDVSWVWSPAVTDASGLNLASLYPGDSYVDWTGMDGYNWGGTTFDQIFHWAYNTILNIAPTKPMMIAEVGCAESVDKVAWFTDMLSTQLPVNYGQVKAFIYWQGPIGGNIQPENTFLVESNPDALAAFRKGIASSYYSSNVYGSLNISPIPTIGENTTPTPTPTPIPIIDYQNNILLVVVVVVISLTATIYLYMKMKGKRRNAGSIWTKK